MTSVAVVTSATTMADNDDKPFACSFPGCTQKFITEDKLSFHMMKHDLSLTALTSSLFTDQTPTPTTFLRDCDNMGLFQDLPVPLTSKNPFDESFRKAVIEPDGEISEVTGVETPSIPILPDSANILSSMSINTPTSSRDMHSFMKYRPVFLTPDVNKLHSQISNDNLDTPSIDKQRPSETAIRNTLDTPTTLPENSLLLGLPRSTRSRRSSASTLSDGGSTTESSPNFNIGSEDPTLGVMPSTPLSEVPTPSPSIEVFSPCPSGDDLDIIVPTSMQPGNAPQTVTAHTSGHMVSALTADTVKHAIALPQKLAAPGPILPRPQVTATTNSAQSLVMLHLNRSGGAYLVPANAVQGPQTNHAILPLKLSSVGIQNQPMGTVIDNMSLLNAGYDIVDTTTALGSTVGVTPQSPLTLAKMKLKQSLTKNQLQMIHTSTNGSQAAVSDSETSARSRHSSSASGIQKRSLSISDEDLDEEEKKKKILQRNRDAARRCRKKRKTFIQNLEENMKATDRVNAQLRTENTKLKMEITELKSFIIAHKDCEVTRKQMAEGSLNSLLLGKTPNS